MNSPLTFGRFRVLRLLGRGAQGAVFLAKDPELERLVAIKTLTLSTNAEPGRVERLMKEARLGSRLSHPNIVPVFEVGLKDGAPYIVFEYVEGCTLAQRLQTDGAMPVDGAVAVMSRILAGVAHAHSRGIVHGDITPGNIMLSGSGIPRVMDFGIARGPLDARPEATMGTVPYMAPEHFQGNATDRRTDVYALGLVFWELLTGKQANPAKDVASAIHHLLSEQVPPPSSRNTEVDPGLDAVVERALQRSPDARYADAGEMQAELDRFATRAGDRTAEVHDTVAFVLRRMRYKSSFPALSKRFSAINQLTSSADDASVRKLAHLIMQDFALTQRLLQIVNSAANGHSPRVTSIRQAILRLGMAQVRAIANGIMLATPPAGTPSHPALNEVLLGAFVAAVMGRNACRLAGSGDVDEAFVCAMFSRLGEILAILYLTEDYDEIVRTASGEPGETYAAARAVLGLDFEELGAAVASLWNFPGSMLQAMRALPPGRLDAPRTERERVLQATGFARELCEAARLPRPEARDLALCGLMERFGTASPTLSANLGALIGQSLNLGLRYCELLGLRTQGSALIEGLKGWTLPIDAPRIAPTSSAVEPAASEPSPTPRVTAPDSTSPGTAKIAPGGVARPAGSGVGGWVRRLMAKPV